MASLQLFTRNVVRVDGDDARKLLNDTLTCRFDESLAGRGRWFALLSPQGKVQVEGLVTEADGAYWFDLDARLVADFLKRMKLYRLRAKVEFEPMPGLAVLWSPDGETPAQGIVYRDERHAKLGTRSLVPFEGERQGTANVDADLVAPYNAARIAAGIAEFGTDFGVNEVFAHDIALDLLGGIDFKKGCYIGQEVVSRMHHRGTARRRPVVVEGIPEGAAAGAPLLVGEREVGNIGAPLDGTAVAIVRLDRIDPDIEPRLGGLPVQLTLPSWATYRFGEEPAIE